MNVLGIILFIVSLVSFCLIWRFKRQYLSLFVLIIFLFLPKINIISIDFLISNIRTNDIILMFFLFVILIEKFASCKQIFKSKIFLLFCIFLTSSLISFVYGIASKQTLNVGSSVFGIISKINYFCLVFVGADLLYHNKENTIRILRLILKIFTVYTLVLAIPQYFDLLGVFRYGEYTYLSVGLGTFHGPYEVGAFFNVVFGYCVYSLIINKTKVEDILLAISSVFIILLSKSRTSLIVCFILLLIIALVYGKKKTKIIVASSTTILVSLLIVLISLNSLNILNRFSSLNIKSMYDTTKYYINNLTYEDFKYVVENNLAFEDFAIQQGDLSFNVRMFKWIGSLKSFPKNFLFGYGFGSNPTLDGNYVKLLVENGIVGLLLFILSISIVLKYRKENKFGNFVWIFLLTILIHAVLIDIFEASKMIGSYWLYSGLLIPAINNSSNFNKTFKSK